MSMGSLIHTTFLPEVRHARGDIGEPRYNLEWSERGAHPHGVLRRPQAGAQKGYQIAQ